MHRLTLLLLPAVAACFYVTEDERAARWDLDGDSFERPSDCDDSDPALAAESRFFTDEDGDGFGDRNRPVIACEQPAGTVTDDTDCDDDDPSTFPGAAERCDGSDNDCDEAIDENLSQIEWFPDLDLDGWGGDAGRVLDCARPGGYLPTGGDCDDDDPLVNPDRDELACNDVDDDCDDAVDEPSALMPQWYPDADADGYGTEVGAVAQCDAPTGDWAAEGGDCAPLDPDTHPGAEEVCNGADDDCNDLVDDDPTDPYLYFPDLDLDGFGDENSPGIESCDPAPGPYQALNNFDCEDGDDQINPAAPECLDGVDNDCDGLFDEASCLR